MPLLYVFCPLAPLVPPDGRMSVPPGWCPLTSVYPLLAVRGRPGPRCLRHRAVVRSSPCKELFILFSLRPQHCQVTSGGTPAARNYTWKIIPTLGQSAQWENDVRSEDILQCPDSVRLQSSSRVESDPQTRTHPKCRIERAAKIFELETLEKFQDNLRGPSLSWWGGKWWDKIVPRYVNCKMGRKDFYLTSETCENISIHCSLYYVLRSSSINICEFFCLKYLEYVKENILAANLMVNYVKILQH